MFLHETTLPVYPASVTYDGTPLRNPNIFKVLEITKKWLETICFDISNGKNTFKDNYETILNEFKEL